jgi:DNA-binding NarL/FixJ family response regulator
VAVRPIELHATPETADVVIKSFERFGRRERLAIQAIRRENEAVPIVVVLGEISLRAVHEAIDAGAQSVVWASTAETTLAAAVRAACSGLVSFPAEVRERFARPALSAREKQVLGLVVMGLGNSEIGSTLHIAQTTVKTHLASIFEKLGVRSRNEAVSVVLDPVQGRGLGVLAITQGVPGD